MAEEIVDAVREPMTCPDCFGDGWVVDEHDFISGGYLCPACAGDGFVESESVDA